MTKEQFDEILKTSVNSTDVKQLLATTKMVASAGNPYFICDFAEYVDLSGVAGAMEILEDVMLEYKDPYHPYEFAFCMADSEREFNLSKFEANVIASGNAKLMYYFMGYVKGCNIMDMTMALLKTGCSKWIEHYIENEEIPKMEDADVIFNAFKKAKQTSYIPPCLKPIFDKHEGDFSKVQAEVKNSGDAYLMTELAEHFEQADREGLLQEALETKDILNVYEYGCSVPGAPVDAIAEKIVERGVSKLMWYVAEYTDWGCEKLMLGALRQSGNDKYITKIEEKFIPQDIEQI